MFVGRGEEIAELEKLYKTRSFQMVLISGRRKVGKSTLIARFVRNKRAIFFSALEADRKRNLDLFSRTLMKLMGAEGSISLGGWEAAFDGVAVLAEEPLVLVIDQFPHLLQAERGILAILRRYGDRAFRDKPLMVILCGPQGSMEDLIKGDDDKEGLRSGARIELGALGYRDSADFVLRYGPGEKALVYGLTGGIPRYLDLFDDSLPFRENVIGHVLSPGGYLYEEAANLLKRELREPAKYNLIIEAAAKGASRLSEIASRTGLGSSAAANYVSSLISRGIIHKETALTEEESRRKTLYRLADTTLAFWYRYVWGNEGAILTGNAGSLYDYVIAPDLNRFMEPVFETMCHEYLARMNDAEALPCKILRQGRWWDAGRSGGAGGEIDIVGINEKLSFALFGSCFFQNEPADIKLLKALVEKGGRWNYERRFYVLFSRSGFTPGLLASAKNYKNLRLVGLQDMY